MDEVAKVPRQRLPRTGMTSCRRLAPLFLGLLAACAGGGVGWPEAPAVGDPEPSGPGYLREYKESHYRELGTDFDRTLTEEAFVKEVQSARVLFLGDVHDDVELHRDHLRLLDALLAFGWTPALGLEAVGSEDDALLRQHTLGDLPMVTLRNAIRARWPETWLEDGSVDAAFYRALLERARRHRLPVFGLEPTPRLPLEERDARIAANVRRAAAAHPGRPIVVVVGHTHLLGQGALIRRIGLPSIAVGARLSPALERRAASRAPGYARTSGGVWYRKRL